MAKKVKIELNTKNIGALLKSEDTAKMLQKAAEQRAQGWETDTKKMSTRYIASIYTTDRDKAREEIDNHRLVGGLK